MSSDALLAFDLEQSNITTDSVNFSPTLVVAEIPVNPVNPDKGFLCLNMIVKNESRIIERLLGSVLGIIDTYCICDTGSTDDTIVKIETFMKNAGKPGIVFSEPFQDFGTNRTIALEKAAEWGVYALLLDADMKLEIEPSFNKKSLSGNGYSIRQKSGTLEYYNTRIVKTGIGVRCVCPTHEYYSFPNGGEAKLHSLWINDIGDGGSKADKFERDIRLLKKGLEQEPNNGRYYFYLANSYRDLAQHQNAIDAYKKRIEIGGWIEELFHSCLEIGNMYKRLNEMDKAVYWWLEAYNRHPVRAESLYEIVKHYREVGKHHSAILFYNVGRKIPYPKRDVLFINHQVYDFLFDYEYSILAFYVNGAVDHYKYLNLIGKDYQKDTVKGNYQFYAKRLESMGGVDYKFSESLTKSFYGRQEDFKSSSASIIPYCEGYIMNVRYVNYRLNDGGEYFFRNGTDKIASINKIIWLNRDLEVLRTHWIDKVQDESLRYQGIEDVKIFSHDGNILFLGTVQHPQKMNLAVGSGTYDLTKDCLYSKAQNSPFDRYCEKNWCYFHTTKGELRMVYEWSPLTVMTSEQTIVARHTEVPDFFRDIRGSTHGMLVNDELWFVAHLVHYSTPRHYYHIIIVLDAKTFAYKRHSILFKFHKKPIEFVLGFIVEPSRFLFSYSQMDGTTDVMVLPRSAEKELFPE